MAPTDAANRDLVDDPISAEEAESIIAKPFARGAPVLMDVLLEGVFIAPAKTAAQAAARQARKNAGPHVERQRRCTEQPLGMSPARCA
ncbi:hypothetical protein [Streptomyces sp.]|uniref:hypothetical protein n=1 Tax=Streptomyces sp. TaxID=1931 RepID=UPI002D766105|nr:hypothetical protein [Streptomyces sp.]HET6353490.1 hypothetical protein [Streptomyces sp.]